MKKWIIASAVVLLFAGYAMAESGRETLRNPPQEIEMLSEYSSAETWAYRIKDTGEVVRFQIDSDGTANVYNSSGTKVWGVSAEGLQEMPEAKSITELTWTSGTGFTIPATQTGSLFTFDMTAVTVSNETAPVALNKSGVTLTLFTPTAATDGKIYPLLKTDSGTTDLTIYVEGGLPLGTSSGVTNVDMDAEADILYLMADYNSAVSWWIVNRYIH